MEGLKLVGLAERPDLGVQVMALNDMWPEFVLQDPCSALYISNRDQFREWAFVLVSSDQPDIALGRVLAVPLPWFEPVEHLPDRGWDAAIELAVSASYTQQETNAVCALEVTLAPGMAGRGLSRWCLQALREIAATRDATYLFAPVRPPTKSRAPLQPMRDFLAQTSSTGQVVDPWLRTHLHLGGEIVRIAPFSMTITGTFEQWSTWTGMDFSDAGHEVVVEGGLVPVLLNTVDRVGVYVEPNVWIVHRLDI